MALLSVADALARVLAHAAPLPAERGAARRSRRPRACRRSQGAAHAAAGRRLGHGRLCRARRRCGQRAGAAESHRRGRRRPAVCARDRSRRGGAHFHRRRGAGRRRHGRDPGVHQARRRLRRRARSPTARAATSARKGSTSKRATFCFPPGHRLTRARPRARRRHEPSALPVHRRPKVALFATGDELVPPGVEPGPGQIVSSNAFALAALARAEGADVDRSRHCPRPARRYGRGGPPARANSAPTFSSPAAAPRSANTTSCRRRLPPRAWNCRSGRWPCGPAVR